MRYRKKPVEIRAFKFGVDPTPNWFCEEVIKNNIILFDLGYETENDILLSYLGKECEIKTLEGIMKANTGDYIIKGVKGEIYPCKSDIFEMTYEKIL